MEAADGRALWESRAPLPEATVPGTEVPPLLCDSEGVDGPAPRDHPGLHR